MGHTLKALFVSIVLAMLVIAAIPVNAAPTTASRVDLIAGGGNLVGAKDVGDVFYWVEGNYLYVQIVTTGGWYFTSTEVEVKTSYQAIPQANGNPIPGKFSSKKSVTGTDTTHQINIGSLGSGTLYIAVHANVQKGGLNGVALALPDTATINVAGGTISFGSVTITNGGMLNGVYKGWCVDVEHSITPGTPYTAQVYSSYESLPGGVVDKPQNLDLVNWVLNQNYLGKTGPTGVPYSVGDIQLAIWTLIDNSLPTYPPAHTDANVNAIVSAAIANGEGFVPGPGQIMAIILKPAGCAQVLIIEFRVPSGCGGETAWASKITKDGAKITSMNFPFPGNNWATYFKYIR